MVILGHIPDPEKLAAHLKGVRAALDRAREAEAPETRIRAYEGEIGRIEQLLGELRRGDLSRWETRSADDLTKRALRWSLPDPDPDGPAQQHPTPGLPLLIPNVPRGLTPEETERHETRAWMGIYRYWADFLAGRLKLHAPEEREAMKRLIRQYGLPRKRLKQMLAGLGLQDAMNAADEPTRIRVGSGEGSGYVRDESGAVAEAPPTSYRLIGGLVWLAQEALARAKRLLLELGDVAPEDPTEEVARSHAETSEALDRAPDALDALVAEEATQERLADLYAATRGRENEKLDALLAHLEDGCTMPEARKRAAKDLGVSPKAIDMTLSRLRRRRRM